MSNPENLVCEGYLVRVKSHDGKQVWYTGPNCRNALVYSTPERARMVFRGRYAEGIEIVRVRIVIDE